MVSGQSCDTYRDNNNWDSSQPFTLGLVIHICVIRVSRVIAGRLGALLIVEKEDSE